MENRARRLERKAAKMAALVLLQALACTFFLADVIADVLVEKVGLHLVVEALAAAALLVAVVLGAFQARGYVAAARRDEAAVATAQGALSDLIRMRFEAWRLTPAEADVALFALKGCDVGEIAALRGSASGTVRAQLARVYAKAGVVSHSGLIAMFLEELIDLPGQVPAAEAA